MPTEGLTGSGSNADSLWVTPEIPDADRLSRAGTGPGPTLPTPAWATKAFLMLFRVRAGTHTL